MGYIAIGLLVTALIFFLIAIYFRRDVRRLKYTALGLTMLGVVGLLVSGQEEYKDFSIAPLVFIFLAAMFYGSYKFNKNR